MAKAKKALSMLLVVLMTMFTFMSYVPAKAAEVLPKVAHVMIVDNPAKFGVEQKLYLTSKGYTGDVQYKVFYIQRDADVKTDASKWTVLTDWTQPVKATDFTEIKVPANVADKAARYDFAVRVKKAGTDGTIANTLGGYDDAYLFRYIYSDASDADLSAVKAEKESYAVGEEVKFTGVKDGYEYFQVKEDGSARANNKNMFVQLAGNSFKPTTAGEYVFEIRKADKSAWTFVKVNVVDKLQVESVSAIKANQIKVVLNKSVDTAKTSIVVKKGSISTNISKTEWTEEKNAVVLTTTTRLSKGEYTVNVSTDTEKDVIGKVTVDDEKVTKIDFTSDKLVLANDTLTEAKVGYAVYNQYNEDISSRISTINWSSSVGTPSAAKGVLAISYPTKFQLDQKVVVTALETVTGTFASATLTVDRKAYINEISIGELASDDAKVTVLNVASIKHFYLPVTLKDQYGNIIKDKNIANKNSGSGIELLKIASNIDGTFDNDDDGNLIFVLAPTAQQFPGKAMITFVAANSGNRAEKEFEIVANPALSNITMEFPDIISAGDSNVDIKYTALDQFGNEVKDVDTLNGILKNLGVTGGNLTNANFKFRKDVKTGEIKLTLDASKATAGRVSLKLLTPGNNVFTANFEVKDARKYVVVSGISSKLVTNYVIDSTGKITSSQITLLDQYGKTWSLADLPSDVKVNLSISGDGKIITPTSAVLTGGDSKVEIKALAKGTATVTATIAGVADSDYTFKLNVMEAKNVTSYDVADIPTLNGNIGATYTLKVTGKLSDGSSIALDYSVIKGIVSSNPSVVTVEADRTIRAVAKDEKTDDATAKIIVTIEGPEESVTIPKDVKVSYKKAVPASIEADPDNEDIVNGVAYVAGDTDLKTLFVVTDQYGKDIADIIIIIKTNVKADGCDVVAFTSNGLSAQLKVVYTSAVVDKAALRAEIAKAADFKEADYTTESWAAYQAALKAAKDVDTKADATQADVDKALADLKAAKLVVKPVADITATADGIYINIIGGSVDGTISDKNNIVKDFSNYTVKVTTDKGLEVSTAKANADGSYSVKLGADTATSLKLLNMKVIVVVNDGTKDVYTSPVIALKDK